MRHFLKYWLPLVVWMTIIFSASGDSASFQHSSRIIGPLLHWLVPALSDGQVHLAVVVVRKGAHVSEYAILTWLIWRLLRSRRTSWAADWSWPAAGWTLLIVLLYAASDEFHQSFVPSREASVRDVLIDSSGALLALLFLCLAARCRPSWFKPIKVPQQSGPVPLDGMGAD